MKNKKNSNQLSFPKRFLSPIKHFLESELVKLKRREKDLKKDDPFSDSERTTDNSLEDDVDEQVGHFDSEVKVNFVKKRMVAFRKALTKIKLGNYGTCESCHKMIDTDRLAVKPEATRCIKCEKENDK